jgi:hypothetical protein
VPSTDIDGSPIVILTQEEAKTLYDACRELSAFERLSWNQAKAANKIARELKLTPLE